MDLKEQKESGVSLFIGSILMVVTMVLHPVGGDFSHLVKIVSVGMIAHGIAILSVPFVAYGYWGLMQRLNAASFLSKAGFSIMLFGLIAVMIAAAINGLILMDFVKSYEGASEQTIASLKPFFRLIRSFNHAFDFIFIGAVCLSMLLWSIAILRTKAMPQWVAYLGIVLSIIGGGLFLSGYELVHLAEFRLFVFGNVAWILAIGLYLRKG